MSNLAVIEKEQDEPKAKEHELDKQILQLLRKHAHSPKQLAKATGASIRNVHYSLGRLFDESTGLKGKVEKMPGTHYYIIRGKHYDFTGKQPHNIPLAHWPELTPELQLWWKYAKNNPTRRKNFNIFFKVCTGRIVPTFEHHPSFFIVEGWERWHYPFFQFKTSFERFYAGRELPLRIRKALREYANIALGINLKVDKARVEEAGLKIEKAEGKYRHIRLTPDEIEQAIAWIDGPEGAAVAGKYLIDGKASAEDLMHSNTALDDATVVAHDELRAHFAYSISGCHRPSSLLTTEVATVEHLANPERLEYQSYETKTKSTFQKFIEDPRLVQWAWQWANRRRAFHYRFLFWDANSYIPRRNDAWRLAARREKYGACYRELFRYLGKSEQIYYSDTLYCFRKISAHYWVDKKGLSILPVIAAMGWKNESTLRDYYFDVTRERARSALFGNEGPPMKA